MQHHWEPANLPRPWLKFVQIGMPKPTFESGRTANRQEEKVKQRAPVQETTVLGSTILTASPTMEVSAEVAPAPTPEEPMSWIDELEQQLKHEIASSRAVVAEHADSDEVTAPAALWDEALAMLLGSLSNASPETIAGLPLPTISDGYDGTIDVSWRFQSRHLLLTLQGRDTHTATFSGRIADSPIDIFQGEIDTQRSNHWLLCWLTQ